MNGLFRMRLGRGRKSTSTAGALAAGLAVLMLVTAVVFSAPADATSRYTVLAANDLGMHCIQPDYKAMMILPPANFLHVQVFRRDGDEAPLVTSGIKVTYAVQNAGNLTKHSNFWQYASSYGFTVKPGQGITGNWLRGTMKLSADRKFYEATAIPVLPYTTTGTFNPYPVATVTVTSKLTGTVLATLKNVVLPVSDEMHCDYCHTAQPTFKGILATHDKLSGTHLVGDLAAGQRHACNDCHADPVLGVTQNHGGATTSLSEAMHSFHGDKMGQSQLVNTCYNCHPGLQTRCLRGAMAAAGKTCVNCHGDVAHVGESIATGRTPWLGEPDCSNASCHSIGANPGKLYRQSYLMDGPEGMNNKILCESCHNGTHAEFKSTRAIDNKVPLAVQGVAAPIGTRCAACHSGTGKIHGHSGGNTSRYPLVGEAGSL